MKTTQRRNGNRKRGSYRKYARILAEHKKDLQERYRVKEIGIFGSYVRGEQKTRSDIDILVDFNGDPDFSIFMRLADFLEEILHKKVDLVRRPVLRKELREQVLKEVIFV
jgi:predicted nucleotidyltransferase